MIALLHSPRRRRRLGWAAAFGLPLVALVAFAVHVGNTGTERSSAPSGPVGLAEEQTADATPALELTPSVRRGIDRLVDSFVAAAVLRGDPAAAWDLSAPELRSGIPRGAWNAGELPVQPYPRDRLAKTEWRLAYVEGRTVGIDVVLHPKRGSGQRPQVYAADVVALGRDEPYRLLVRSWAPLATLASGDPPRQPTPGAAEPAQRGRFSEARLSGAWLLVPASLLALLVVAPAVLITRSVLRDRKAQRLYREHTRH